MKRQSAQVVSHIGSPGKLEDEKTGHRTENVFQALLGSARSCSTMAAWVSGCAIINLEGPTAAGTVL